MCFQCVTLGRLVTQVPGRPDKVWYTCNEVFDLEQGMALIDQKAEAYLKEVLETLQGFHAIDVDGDGNCLAHALSRCMMGAEVLYHGLRSDLSEELFNNVDFYAEALGEYYDADTLQAELIEAAEDAAPSNTGTAEDGLYSHLGKSLSPLHVFALANVLRRPIVLYAAPRDWGNSNAGVYLPAREGVAMQEDGTPVPPVLISWSSSQLGHFVALAPISSNSSQSFPVPSSALPRTEDGHLLVFGPYDEAACQPYMQDGSFVVRGNSLENNKRTLLLDLHALWKETNPGVSWEMHMLQGRLQRQQDKQLLRLMAGGGLDAVHPVSNYEKKKKKAMREAGGGVVFCEPLVDENSKLTPNALAVVQAIFSRHTHTEDVRTTSTDVMNKTQMEAWLDVCEEDSAYGRRQTVMALYGENDVLTRDSFVDHYLEEALTRPKSVWRDILLHDFGYDLRPMGDETRQWWVEPPEPESADDKANPDSSSNAWEVLDDLYGWTRLPRAVEEAVEERYQELQLDDGAQQLSLTIGGSLGYLIDFSDMTCQDTVVARFQGLIVPVPRGEKHKLRRRVLSDSEVQSALPGGLASVLQGLLQNQSADNRSISLSGFGGAASTQEFSLGNEWENELVQTLVAMDISEPQARKACRATNNRSVDAALEWHFEHMGEDSEDQEMQRPLVAAEDVETGASRSSSVPAGNPTNGESTSVAGYPAKDAQEIGSDAAHGFAQQLATLQQEQTSKVRVYLGDAVVQKASCTEDSLPPPPPLLVRAMSLQVPRLARSTSNEDKKAMQTIPAPTLTRHTSAPPQLGLDWSRAWAATAK